MNRFLTTLGLARRAGKIHYGYDMVLAGMEKTAVVFLSEECAPRSRKDVKAAAQRAGVSVLEIPYTMAALGVSIGTKPVGIIGVIDRGFAGSLTTCIEGGK